MKNLQSIAFFIFFITSSLFLNTQNINAQDFLSKEVIKYNFNDYVGSSQFFDIAGEWVNENDTLRRITRLQIKPTLLKTYMVNVFFALGKKEFPIGGWSKLNISEYELAYKANVAETTCLVMPFADHGEEKLLVYSLIVDPSGIYTGKTLDVLVRKERQGKGIIAPTYDPYEVEGYWINEMEDGGIITQIHITKNKSTHKTEILPFRVNSQGKNKASDQSYELKKMPNGDLAASWALGELKTKYLVHPLLKNNKIQGLDIIIEEVYSDGTPRNIYRQFMIADPEAELKIAAESLMQSLEGWWVNVDAIGATKKVFVNDGEIELFVEQSNSLTSLGKRNLKPVDNGRLGADKETFTRRTDEIETDLDINSSLNIGKPVVIAINTTIENMEGLGETINRTEIFVREDFCKNIPASAYEK